MSLRNTVEAMIKEFWLVDPKEKGIVAVSAITVVSSVAFLTFFSGVAFTNRSFMTLVLGAAAGLSVAYIPLASRSYLGWLASFLLCGALLSIVVDLFSLSTLLLKIGLYSENAVHYIAIVAIGVASGTSYYKSHSGMPTNSGLSLREVETRLDNAYLDCAKAETELGLTNLRLGDYDEAVCRFSKAVGILRDQGFPIGANLNMLNSIASGLVSKENETEGVPLFRTRFSRSISGAPRGYAA